MFLFKNIQIMLCRINNLNQRSKCLLHQNSSRLLHSTLLNSNFSCFTNNYNSRLLRVLSLTKTSLNPLCSSTIRTSNRNTINDTTNILNENVEERHKNEWSWKMMKYSFIFFGISISIVCLSLIYEVSKPSYDENGNMIQDEFNDLPFITQIYCRLKREVSYYKKLVQEPSRDKLLPDPLKHPYIQPPFTIILELTDVLVHPDWTYQTGWRFKKRPGIDHFLEAIAPPKFETVVYTAEQGLTVFPILDALDSQGYIMYRLVRDATRFVDGHHVKDLDALNRDLKKVIVIDWNSESVKFHSENMLKIPRWNGSDNDTTLYDLAAFLKTIYETNVDDVRDVINYYSQFENPLETFRENQRKLLVQLEEEANKAHMNDKKLLTSKWRPTF